MRIILRAAAAALCLVLALAACGTDTAPTAAPLSPTGTPVPTAGAPAAAGSDAYNAAICPVFTTILALDQRLAALRAAGTAEADIEDHVPEIDAVGDELRGVLNDLEAVPDWGPGNELRFVLSGALHAIRTQLLVVGGDPLAADASEALAAVPFIASTALDRAMSRASAAGLACAPEEE